MKKKLISLLTAAVMVLGMTVPAMAEDTAASMKGKLVVIHTNDMHGYFEKTDTAIGIAGVASLKDYYKAQGADVLLVDAGDFSQGNTLVSYYRGKNAAEYIAASGYDAVSMGNHEFDYTFDELLDNMKVLTDAGVKVVDANVINKATGKSYFDSNAIFEKGGMKIGVFGLDTAETLTKSSPSNVKLVSFLDKEAMFKTAQAQVDELKAAGCNYIIALTHLGVDEESTGRRSSDLASAVKGIDLIIDGHSHTVMDGGIKVGDSTIVSTGSYLANVGTVVIDETSHEAAAKLISAADYAAKIGKYDEKITAMVAEDKAEVTAAYSQVFAKTEVKLEGTKAVVRSQETNLGDFTADAYLYTAQKYSDEHELGIKIDCAISNGGGIRTSVEPGDISKDTLVTIFPFGNNVSFVTITGAQLLEILEASTFCTPETLGGFPQVAGIKYTLNTTVPYENGAQYPDSTYYAPAKPGSRVTIDSVNGTAFDPNSKYTVAVNSFQAEGGDTYYQLTKGSYVCNTEVLDCDSLIQYVEHLNGVIGQEYAKSQGRITIISAPAAAEPVVEPVVETPVVDTPPTVEPVPTLSELYTVAKGDSLWKIAATKLGDGTLWKTIYENNKDTISNPNEIYIGQKLVISK
ncbi:MAG: 5'-nucleotidase C-terminal domain-containing protein [Candidatus Metalachnospira sp.]|nr:5'-nucleotidase C-terminal domain-containing protein [Candidatus Metalachnospira sp.]